MLMGKDRTHIKLFGETANAVAFGKAGEYMDMGAPGMLDILGGISENTYNGRTTLQIDIKDWRKI